MFVSTTDYIPGYQYQILGMVRGNIVTSKNIGRDMMAHGYSDEETADGPGRI